MTRILSLDDDREMGTLYSLIFQRAGYEHFFVTDSQEARTILQTGSIDLLLLDCTLSDVDSWAFIEMMKTDEVLHHIPIIMLLAFDTPGHPEADAYIAKPVSPTELLTTVENLLNNYGRQATLV